MTAVPQIIMFNGQGYKPVQIPATGAWQLMRLQSVKCYILVHPSGRQAWFHDDQINEIVVKQGGKFRYTSNALRDLQKLARLGLVPFHTDPDFDPTALLASSSVN